MELQTQSKKIPSNISVARFISRAWLVQNIGGAQSYGVSEAPAIVPQHVEICLVVAGNTDGFVRRTGAGFC
jgi:hypothetical protein